MRYTLLIFTTLFTVSALLTVPTHGSAATTTAFKKAPVKVRTLHVQNVKKYGATLKWKKQKRATYYKVQLLDADKNRLKTWKRHKKRKRVIKKRHGHLQQNTSYWYRVKACNTVGCGKWSFKTPFTTQKAPSSVPADILAIEADAIEQVNEYRASLGLSPLTNNEAFSTIAREHSEQMATGATPFGHDGFNDRFARMAALVGSGSVGGAENVAWGTDRPGLSTVIVNGWIGSDGHRRNIEGSYVQTGMGVAQYNGRTYFTQLFLSR